MQAQAKINLELEQLRAELEQAKEEPALLRAELEHTKATLANERQDRDFLLQQLSQVLLLLPWTHSCQDTEPPPVAVGSEQLAVSE